MLIEFIIGIAVLGLLVFVHEGGHFLIAKWRKVKVNTFSIGFGPSIFKKKIGETEYKISAIPFGGYVAMAGENPGEINGDDCEFASKKIWERMAIAFAGPLFNIIFAFFILWIGFAFIGMESTKKQKEDGVIIGYIFDSLFDATSSLEMGDKIVTLNNEKVKNWSRLNEIIIFTDGDSISASVKKVDGSLKVLNLPVVDTVQEGMPIRYIPIMPQTDVIIRLVKDSTPAASVGIKKKDRVISVNGEEVGSVMHFVSIIDSTKCIDTLNLTIERDSQLVEIRGLVPADVDGDPRIGVALTHKSTYIEKYSVFGAIGPAFMKSADIIRLTFVTFEKLFTGHVKLKHMSGPVGIVKATGTVAGYGINYLFFFIALISINLGLFNLLPLMITDGGLIMFFTIEAIRGKPLSVENQARIQQVAMVIFISFALFITFVDIQRLIG